MVRRNGILMHLSSLASDNPIGTMGKCAYDFADFLKESGQTYWQILPICPTGYGDSPYASFSTFAGNPYLVDLDLLVKDGLLKKSDYKNIDFENSDGKVNYSALYTKLFPVLRKAMTKFLKKPTEEFMKFCSDEAFWLDDYALFMALKKENDDKIWLEWPDDIKNRDLIALKDAKERLLSEFQFWQAIQYFFFKQWFALKEYVNNLGIKFIGDCPIYVALDSVDAWANPKLFQFDEDGLPKGVAGCPPDGFSATGQLWGNPLYDWDYHASTRYAWWISRIGHLNFIYDIVRIDHFRGFDSYYNIPYGDLDATRGRWCKGPGMDLFNELKKHMPDINIIAEDLGFLTDSVKQLLSDSGFPGMKVLEFAFDTREASSSNYLPHTYPSNSIAYCGTHDNSTILGWLKNCSKEDIKYAKEYMLIDNEEDFNWKMMSILMMSNADITILQAQDILDLDDSARMNIPSTTGINWQWRANKKDFNKRLSKKLYTYTARYGRSAY